MNFAFVYVCGCLTQHEFIQQRFQLFFILLLHQRKDQLSLIQNHSQLFLCQNLSLIILLFSQYALAEATTFSFCLNIYNKQYPSSYEVKKILSFVFHQRYVENNKNKINFIFF
ncbi:hypothetical protein TTHERM_000481319 (macronuclear) [Tetrahymena thermophila SB210]|uniref:Uncharacterized protein n=1 Tax=Tetrahymena thermophila (strain SB210) TaxID=312017 RepID=W7XHV0_TETTS|nr:hypothetical protein TTHERM_000481319 [Tetrahymena thermophila SB210]EWS74071.1 hypothetical protein TTHERM_000481319 [Tetrahymena thermophila SB210]|eukprot:XP_012653404.1 hypothetical protein TTHERM_000481319 [Tetrahymena thermophila SB210]